MDQWLLTFRETFYEFTTAEKIYTEDKSESDLLISGLNTYTILLLVHFSN